VAEELLSLTKKLSKPEISSVGVQTVICCGLALKRREIGLG